MVVRAPIHAQLRVAMYWFAHLKMFSLHFSVSLFVNRVNLLLP